jgi:hypothetical protein
MELTHEKYAERFADQFGATMDGIFTDEPNMNFNPGDCIPWTDRCRASSSGESTTRC